MQVRSKIVQILYTVTRLQIVTFTGQTSTSRPDIDLCTAFVLSGHRYPPFRKGILVAIKYQPDEILFEAGLEQMLACFRTPRRCRHQGPK